MVATSEELTLVEPVGVGSAAPCLVGGNVLYLDGDSWVYGGTQTIQAAKWGSSGTDTNVHIDVTPTDLMQGSYWNVYFDSSQLGAPLAPGIYEGAQRWPFMQAGHPGLDVNGDSRGCNTVSGRFQVQTLTWNGPMVSSFTATFEHLCEGWQLLRGCVHYER
ncbi:MAG: hypothetical protein QM765_29035 [Myxococcales bacterium]